MPPQTRTRATKVLKENREVVIKNKLKSDGKVTKPPRKALADKTNSLSDDNASIDIPVQSSKTVLKRKAGKSNGNNNVRPRRERRLPPRYVENQVLKNLSNNKDSPAKQNPVPSEVQTPVKNSSKNSSLIIGIKNKDVITNALNNSNNTQSPTKVSSKGKEKPSKSIKSVKNSDKPVLHTDSPSKEGEQPMKLNIPARNADKFISANGPSKKDKTTAVSRPKRNCRIQSAIEKPASKLSSDSSRNVSSPFKTPSKDLESSLVVNRPKRICRLPSRFEDHSISPNKFIPVQPCFASTPIQQKNPKTTITNNNNLGRKGKVGDNSIDNEKCVEKPIKKVTDKNLTKINGKADSTNSSTDKSSPDTNNNGRNKMRAKRANINTKLQTKQAECNKITPFAKRLVDKSLSFRVLEDKQTNGKGDNLDVYEFTFDPNEEPKQQKKKRKKPVKKKPAKPKVVVLKSNYNDNVSKAISNLKAKVKPSQSQTVENNVQTTNNNVNPTAIEKVQSSQAVTIPIANDIPLSNNHSVVNITPAMPPANESVKNSIHASNYASIRVEDIAADFEMTDHQNDINYSPVNSPHRPATPEAPEVNERHIDPINKDPLNLQGDVSFFDEQPVASSSMNISIRHPLASPWRVEFGSLPMRWHSNTYVKPNMTPAVESSFINSEETTKKKHIYTNMVPVNESLPDIVDNAPTLKQPTIISFMREVAERSANKKKRRRSPSPTKANSIFDDVTNTSNDFGYKTPKKAKKTAKVSTPNVSNESNEKSKDKEHSNQSSNKSVSPVKAQKKKDKDCTYFGFEDNESIDQENVSPVKIVSNTRTRGLRSRAVLQEFNAPAGPTRAVMPAAAKAKLTSTEVVEQLYDQLKSADDAPTFPEKETAKEPADNTVVTNVDNPSWHEEDDDDSQSVHLFEDMEVVHHLKPYRKSYGKPKKVAFQQRSNSDSDTPPRAAVYSSDDDLADLTFQMPNIKQKKAVKKRKPKKQLSKKEEKEVEEWAAGFNSMCEDIDEFALVVE